MQILLTCVILVSLSVAISVDCQEKLDTYCNSDAGCVAAVKTKGFKLPLVARKDVGRLEVQKQWRCYSPSSLSPNLSHYKNGSAYCSRNVQLSSVLGLCGSNAVSIKVDAVDAFTKEEILRCALIRTPQLVSTASGKVLLFAQCRVALLSGETSHVEAAAQVGDDFRMTRMVMKESADGGKTWGAMRFLTKRSTGVGVAIYDNIAHNLVFQFQQMPSSDPYKGNTLWQMTSSDEGATWSKPRNLTSMIAFCNANPKEEMMAGAAGSRIQTSTGRIIFSGHNKGEICVWFSDDGGNTYQTQTQHPFTGNEHSIAQLSDGSLYMNGRGVQFPWKGNRTGYRSYDGGLTWSAGVATSLTDVNCEAAVVAVNATLQGHKKGSVIFFSEPTGPGRVSFRIHCSCDDGASFPYSVVANPGAVAAYSSLLWISSPKPKLLAVWEQNPKQLSYLFDVDWCKCMAPSFPSFEVVL